LGLLFCVIPESADLCEDFYFVLYHLATMIPPMTVSRQQITTSARGGLRIYINSINRRLKPPIITKKPDVRLKVPLTVQ